ncbi:PrsW family intramembrane metalloprotease [Leekyejoonella antrihumi]|uniref:PrsW family intramembrane metalloprotease n=1 Tax=Leekyejoonella antrihumi TaxID=1660198 RepID=UPI0016479637|nr:PrsW family intramembrane metalloprotease [Leekyejoonella antrihumi]
MLLISALTVLFGFSGAAVLEMIGSHAGVAATILGVALSVVVLGIVVPLFLWLDRYEREPVGMLLFAFGWGACVATLAAATLNDVIAHDLGRGSSNSLIALVTAPVVEETLKGLGPLLLLWFRRREVDGIVDGIVYAGLCAAGFAAVEDVLYLANGYASSGEHGLLSTALVRVVMSPFAHPMFTVCTGVGIGIAATHRRWTHRVGAVLLGWLCAVALHSLWNAGAVLSERGWLVFYVGLQVPLFIAFLTTIVLARRHEARALAEHLHAYVVAGWLSDPEVGMLCSMEARRYARAWANAHGGRDGQRQMHDLQDSASELAMLRARIERGQGDAVVLQEEQRLLAHIARLRRPFVGTALYRWPM